METFINEFKESFIQYSAPQKVAYIVLMVMALTMFICAVSLLGGLLQGTPSGDNIPFV